MRTADGKTPRSRSNVRRAVSIHLGAPRRRALLLAEGQQLARQVGRLFAGLGDAVQVFVNGVVRRQAVVGQVRQAQAPRSGGC